MGVLSPRTVTINAGPSDGPRGPQHDALVVLLPMLVVLSTLLFLLLLFLLCVILARRRRGISLGDGDGPVDLSREELLEGAGGFAGVESRWLESASEDERRTYQHAKGVQINVWVDSTRLMTHRRLSDTVPSQFSTNRHHALPIPIDTGEGRLGLVF